MLIVFNCLELAPAKTYRSVLHLSNVPVIPFYEGASTTDNATNLKWPHYETRQRFFDVTVCITNQPGSIFTDGY